MERSRAARRDRVRSRRKQVALYAAAVLGGVAVLAALVAGLRYAESIARPRSTAKAATTAADVSAALLPVSTDTTQVPVEVPNVTGKTYPEAELVLSVAGFVVRSSGATTMPDGTAVLIASQQPPAGTKLKQGEQVTLALATAGTKQPRALVVVLDPGHQAKSDQRTEPLGPGSAETRESGTTGASGVLTKRQECQVALELALRVKTRLEASGVQVLLTRTSNNVDLGNVERAQMANRAGADLFVRLHADAGSDGTLRGVSVLYPGGNAWVKGIETPSKRAAEAVSAALVAETGAPDGGIASRSDLAGFNWSKVPAILVEAGYLTNTEDDRLLANPGYQDKVAAGIVSGIRTYFGR